MGGLANSWTIRDVLADKLCPDDLLQGRAQIRAALADCEHWIDQRLRRLRWIRLAAIGSLASSTAAMVASAFSLWPPEWTSGNWIVGSLLVWGLTEYLPVLVQRTNFGLSKHSPLNDERLAPLRAYLEQAADVPGQICDTEGDTVSREFLLNPWAVLLFSEREEIRQLVTVGSKDLLRTRYPDWLMTSAPQAKGLEEGPEDLSMPMTIIVDRSVTNIDQRTQNLTVTQNKTTHQTSNHFEFVTRLEAQAASTANAPSVDARDESRANLVDERWPCAFSEADFEIRLRIFKNTEFVKVKPAIKPHLVKKYVIAIEQARSIWMLTPSADISAVAEKVGTLVAKGTNGYSGLTNKQSVDWIRALIAGTGQYKHLKEVFAEISYDPAEYGDEQYRLLF